MFINHHFVNMGKDDNWQTLLVITAGGDVPLCLCCLYM